ncbi:MAG: hypothetical protein A2092_06580 [Rhodobacteraceae bacterium GWE1_64_9]|mgnify:CR=1 FL=1|nr:MAG: hypothetical protein A2092_06580 [Rhodobacteraceae bacterium GWE1_64_9]
MQHLYEPIIHKASLIGLAVHVGHSGLCLNDTAELQAIADGQIGVFAVRHGRWLGLIPHRRRVYLGNLGPQAAQIVAPRLAREEQLRVRIVGLTPEHLAREAPPEIHVSVWTNGRTRAEAMGQAMGA